MPAAEQTITNFFAPKNGTTKRKAEEADSDKENTVTKKNAKSATKPARKSASKSVNSKKVFLDSIKTISELVLAQDKKFKAMINKIPNTKAISIANYAQLAAKQLKVLPSLSVTEGVDFMLYLASVTATDMDVKFGMCGYEGQCEKPFARLDAALLALLEKRPLPEEKVDELPKTSSRWTQKDADVGEFKTERPNKQQRNQMDNQRIEWERSRREAKMQRRLNCNDWVSVALVDLKEERDFSYRVSQSLKNWTQLARHLGRRKNNHERFSSSTELNPRRIATSSIRSHNDFVTSKPSVFRQAMGGHRGLPRAIAFPRARQ